MYQINNKPIGETPTCTRGPSHRQLPIIMICIQKNCTRKRLCCLSCIDELHTKHELMSLKKFYRYSEETINYNLQGKDRENTIQTLNQSQNNIVKNLEKIRDLCNQKIDQIVKKMKEHFSSIKESFNSEKLVNLVDNVRTEFSDDKIQEFYQLLKKAQGNLSRPLDQVKKMIANTEKSVTEKISLCIKQIQKSSELITKQILQFKISKTTGNKHLFNSQTKSAFLSILEDGKIAQRTQGSGAYPIAVVNHQFTPENPTVGFKIVQQLGNKGIWLGACILDIVKNFNFQSCYGIGKGTWGIDQVGEHHSSAYSWSHHDTNYNSAPKVGWQFWTGDLVEITIDYEKSVVRFTKNKQFHYEQPVKLDLGPLYAFAGPTHINDSITIA